MNRSVSSNSCPVREPLSVSLPLRLSVSLCAPLTLSSFLLAETEANLRELTDELEELLATKGQNLGSVAPELEVMKQRQQDAAGGGETAGGAAGGWQKSASGQWIGGEVGSPAARSAWQLKEEEAQRVRVRTTSPVALPLQAADSWVLGLFTWCVCWCNRTTLCRKRSALHSEVAALSSSQMTRSAYCLPSVNVYRHKTACIDARAARAHKHARARTHTRTHAHTHSPITTA